MALLSRLGTLSVPLFACLALMSQGTAAQSDTSLVSAADPDKVFEIAKNFGTAALDKDDTTDMPVIMGRVDGTKYGLYFYGCQRGRDCTYVQFNAAWSGKHRATSERINAWHRTSRFGKAFIADNNTTVMQMSINLDNGVTRKNFEDTFEWWAQILSDFRRQVVE